MRKNYIFYDIAEGFTSNDKAWSNAETEAVAEWIDSNVIYNNMARLIEQSLKQDDVVESLADGIEYEVSSKGTINQGNYSNFVFADWLYDEQLYVESKRDDYLSMVNWRELAEDILNKFEKFAA